MYFDPLRDPRYEPLPPTPEEIEAWASREGKRREAWLAGPTEDEQDDWVRRYRRRAALGFAESRLGPSRDDVAPWAEREHKRRQAWLAGPSEQEKRQSARRSERRGLGRFPESELTPTAEEIEAWAKQERGRRQAWLEGPTEHEKQRWVQRETGDVWEDLPDVPVRETDLLDASNRGWRPDAGPCSPGNFLIEHDVIPGLFRATTKVDPRRDSFIDRFPPDQRTHQPRPSRCMRPRAPVLSAFVLPPVRRRSPITHSAPTSQDDNLSKASFACLAWRQRRCVIGRLSPANGW